jgi:ribosome-binding protein aMBF1 (putative translation factor)
MKLTTWSEHRQEMIEQGYLSEEEARENELTADLMVQMIKARREKNISQRELERLSGIKQPVIARIESGTNIPKINTVMRILAPLGMTLKVVPLEKTGAHLQKS